MLAGVGILVAAGWSPAAGAAPKSAAVLGPGQVVTAAGAAGLTVPADGRIRGRQFDAVVTGVGWPADVQVRGHEAVAGSGRRLVVFSVTLTEGVGVGSLFAAGTRASASVEVGTTELSVPMGTLDRQLANTLSKTATASGTFSVSVPAHQHHVVLAMTQDGFTQRFDLWTLRRLAPDPAVLYRAQRPRG